MQSWARNGAPPDVESDGDEAETIELPASAPGHDSKVQWPRECTTSAYESDKNQNMASIYKAAWVATHRHYCKHREEQRMRHAARHMALLEVAQEKAREQAGKGEPNSAEGPWVRNPKAAAARQAAMQAAAGAHHTTNLTGQWWAGQGSAGTAAAHNLAAHNLQDARPAADAKAQHDAGQASKQAGGAGKANAQASKRARTDDRTGAHASDELAQSGADAPAKGAKAARQG